MFVRLSPVRSCASTGCSILAPNSPRKTSRNNPVARFLFINKELGWAGKGRRMTGYNGVNYGAPSMWNAEHQAQVIEIELTPQEYLVAVLDLARCWHLAMRKWIPLPLDATAALPVEVQEFYAGYNLAMDGKPLPDAASLSAKAGHEIVVGKMATETHLAAPKDGEPAALINPTDPKSAVVTTEGTTEPLQSDAGYEAALASTSSQVATPEIPYSLPWFKVVQLAKEAGVNIEDFLGDGRKNAIVDAINSARTAQPAA